MFYSWRNLRLNIKQYSGLPNRSFDSLPWQELAGELPRYLKSKPDITELELSNFSNEQTAQVICNALLECPQITSLSLHESKDQCSVEIMQLIAKNNKIQQLKIACLGADHDIKFEDKSVIALVESRSITDLVIRISVSDIGVRQLTKFNLQSLWVEGRDLSEETMEALITHESITNLDLNGSSMADGGFERFVVGLPFNKTLKELSLTCFSLTAEQWMALAIAIASNQSIEKLELSYNILQGDFFRWLSQALKVNKSLVELKMSECGVSNDDVVELAKGLVSNKTLKTLKMDHNQIGDEGAEALADCENLAEIDLHSNPIGAEGCIALFKSQTLRKLSLPIGRAEKNAELTKDDHLIADAEVPLGQNRNAKDIVHTQKLLVAYGFYVNRSLFHFDTEMEEHEMPLSCLSLLEKNRREAYKVEIASLAESLSEMKIDLSHETFAFEPADFERLAISDRSVPSSEDKEADAPDSHGISKKSKAVVAESHRSSLSYNRFISSSSSSSTTTQQAVDESLLDQDGVVTASGKRKRAMK